MAQFLNGSRSSKVKALKKAVKSGTYNWKRAIESTAQKIISYPQALLWK